jgi:hypothetical protein
MTTLNVAREFSMFPGGRYRRISEFSGEEFRERLLVPAVKSGRKVVVNLDGVAGYGSSFLEEVFGGIVRVMHWHSRNEVDDHLQIETSHASWRLEANQYIDDALKREGQAAA